MITAIDREHMIVDLADYSEIVGAQSADLETGEVLVKHRNLDGTEEHVVVHRPAGVVIVRRR